MLYHAVRTFQSFRFVRRVLELGGGDLHNNMNVFPATELYTLK